MTINGVIYSRGSQNGINTVKSYNRFSYKNAVVIDADEMNISYNPPESINLLSIPTTGSASGSWIDVKDKVTPYNQAYYFIDGSGTGATFKLLYRPDANASGSMIAASYSDVTTQIIQTFEILNGQYMSVNTTGTSVNCMPKILFQDKN